MCTNIYTYCHICIYAYEYEYINKYIYIYVYIYIYLHMYIYIDVYLGIAQNFIEHIYIYVYMHVWHLPWSLKYVARTYFGLLGAPGKGCRWSQLRCWNPSVQRPKGPHQHKDPTNHGSGISLVLGPFNQKHYLGHP